MKLKAIFLSLVIFLLAGCDEIDGQLVVTKAFSIHSNRGQQTLTVGSYKTGLDFKKDRVIANIKTDSSSEVKVTFTVPANSSLPTNGSFELRSAQTGQPVDIMGDVKTVKSQSPVQSGYENCQYQGYDPVCGPNGCINHPGQQWGRQYTEYYYEETDKNMMFYMTEVGSPNKKLAQFKGAAHTSQKIIIRQSQCF